ncbi:MAG: HAMP domain-containing sensor histidine kinase [Erysipelotrichaceae bacterium]|nr:HAMP domain-containing sensor histidine kinase [Erysipelotrichaceae bacterium]
MKRIRIWLSNFTLLQQFLTIGFLTIAALIFFIFTSLINNIDTFVNAQMHSYIHRAQEDYIYSVNNQYDEYTDTNVVHFIYSDSSNKYLNTIPEEYRTIVSRINPIIDGDIYDGKIEYRDDDVVYSIRLYNNNYHLLSIVKQGYRNEFKNALFTGVVNVTMYVVVALVVFIMMWVVSLIRPLNSIRNYINKIKVGEDAELQINRRDEIGEVAEALVSMQNELDQQEHIRQEMIQNISHDLKTPIATIKSYSESIKDGIYPYDTLEKSVDVIIEHANRLEKKVYSLITFNKLGYLTDENEDILNLQMAPVIRKAILSCEVLRNDISIETEIDDDVYFHGEEEPWRVVVENLLDNAIRYAKTTIRISLSKDLLEVYNDGDLMDKDRISKLFKPYEKGTKGKFGLGLSIVKKVTETYGYNVVGENMDDGVVFRVYGVRKFKKPSKKKNSKKGIIES